MAHTHGRIESGALSHSDRGSQYTSDEYAKLAGRFGVRLSVGRTGVCWGNSVAESWFSMLKNEMYYRQSFRDPAASEIRRDAVHRGVLQPPPAALHPRLPHPRETRAAYYAQTATAA